MTSFSLHFHMANSNSIACFVGLPSRYSGVAGRGECSGGWSTPPPLCPGHKAYVNVIVRLLADFYLPWSFVQSKY